MVLCLFVYFLVLNFDWSIILIRKSFGASRHISGKLGVKLAIELNFFIHCYVDVVSAPRARKLLGESLSLRAVPHFFLENLTCLYLTSVILKNKKL